MRTTFTIALIAAASLACSDADLREVRPDRTRDADGIIKLYANREQGDWMLKGKVVQVESALVTDVARNAGVVIATGRTTLTPIPFRIRFHPSESRVRQVAAGDLLTFKARCTGKDEAIMFESAVVIAISRPVPVPGSPG